MKGLNIKKLAAIAVGGALVGSALAPLAAAIDVAKADVVGAGGSPVVSIVAGSNAAASDFVWAGNIAAKVAQLATVDTAFAGGEGTATPTDLSVDLAVGGSSTYSTEYAKTYEGTTYDFNNAVLGTDFLEAASNGQLPFLTNTTKSYRYEGSTYNITVKETVGVKLDAKFVYNNQNIKDLVGYMENAGDFNYVLSLGDGIPAREKGTITKFTDGDTDNVVIPFLGQEFTVQEADMESTTKTLTLMKGSAKAVYNEGDTITGLIGRGAYAGKEMSVKLAAVTQTGSTATYKARFDLYDPEGNLVDTLTYSAGTYLNEAFRDASSDLALETIVYVSEINFEPTTSKGVLTMVIGNNVAKIASGKQYPYDSTNTDTSTFYWTATLDENTAATSLTEKTITKITIKNNLTVWNSELPLWSAGDSLTTAGTEAAAAGGAYAHFLQKEESGLGYDFVKIKFDGFKHNQDTTQIVVGSKNIVYKDNDSVKRTIPFYIKLATAPQTTASQQTINIDTVPFYAKCYKPATGSFVDIDVYDGNRLNGAIVDINGGLFSDWIATDNGPVAIQNAAISTINIDLNGVQFRVMVDLNRSADNNGATLRADANCTFASEEFPTVGGLTVNSLTVNGSAIISQIGLTGYETYSVYMDDTNATRTPNDLAVDFAKTGTLKDTYKYRTYYSSTSSPAVYLLLDNTTDFSNTFTTADVNFVGTDWTEKGDVGIIAGGLSGSNPYHPYYWPDKTDFGNDPSDNSFIIAIFQVRASGTATSAANFRVHIDTDTDNLIQFPQDLLSNYASDVNYFSVNDQPPWSLTARTDLASALYGGVIDFGSTAKLTDDMKTATFTVPDAQIYLIMSLLGEGATQTVEGGETSLGVKEAETVNIAGKDISVSKINYTAGTCTVANATYPKIVSVGQLVYTDSPAPAGKHVIVGGYLVNKLAESVVLGDGSTLQEALTAPGDKVAEVLSNGNIVVAGYTAMDTKAAAQELIAALDALA
ncbi:MAG: S-layer protein [archaeon]